MEEGEKEDREHGGKVGRRRRRADTSRALSVPKSPRALGSPSTSPSGPEEPLALNPARMARASKRSPHHTPGLSS